MSIPTNQIPGVTGPTPDFQLNALRGPYPTPSELEPDPNSPVFDVLASMLLWALSVLAIFIVPTVIVLPYIFFRYGGVPTATQSLTTDPTVLLLTVIGVIPAHLLTLLGAWFVVTKRGQRPFWRSLGWSFSPKFGVWHTAALAVLLWVAGGILAKLIGGGPTDVDILVNSTFAVRLLLALLATTSGPLVEEIVYRGILYPAFEERIGMAWSVGLVSFLFALVHLYQYRNSGGVIAVIVMLSVSLTLVRAFTGRLLPCFIIHLVFNGIVSFFIVFPIFEQPATTEAPKAGIVMLWRMICFLT